MKPTTPTPLSKVGPRSKKPISAPNPQPILNYQLDSTPLRLRLNLARDDQHYFRPTLCFVTHIHRNAVAGWILLVESCAARLQHAHMFGELAP